MPEPLNVHSPAAAFGRQARAEVQVEAALLWAMRLFLGDVETMALRDGTHLGPAMVADAWALRMGRDALGLRLPNAIAAYVAEAQAPSSTPDEAYDTAMAVMTAAGERAWSAQLTSDVLAEALSMDTPAVGLVAAAPRRDSKRGKALREAFDSALGPRSGSMSWGDVAKRDARTAVTGLAGIIDTAEMRNQGVPYKMWVTRRDERVRETHSAADGQRVRVDEPFTVGGYPLMHPGDRSAPARETVNCRCVAVAADGP
jgi:hypothetical protein